MPHRLPALLEQLPPLHVTSTIQVVQSQLSKRDIADNYLDNGIANDTPYNLGFARRFSYPELSLLTKLGMPRVDIVHGAIFLQPICIQNGQPCDKPLIIGRLPPFFQKIGRVNKNIVKTESANEAHYWFLSWRPFDVTLPSLDCKILVFGAEVKTALIKTDHYICNGQLGDMVHSNCYSSSIFTLSELVCLVATRVVRNRQEYLSNISTLKGLLGLIHRYSQSNYSIGVANNSLVLAGIENAIRTIQERGYENILNLRISSSFKI